MADYTKSVLEQIDRAIAKWNDARSRSRYEDCSELEENEQSDIITTLAATIERLAPTGSMYRINLGDTLKKYGSDNGICIPIFVGILKAMKSDYEAGYLRSVNELINADLFADFLQMAEYLLAESYKDPAAVLAGGVLEEHIRKLCKKNHIEFEKDGRPHKADGLNAELYKAQVYSNLDQKSVTAWLDLRNKAAHGKYSEYSKDQVALMLQGIRDFILRSPA